MQSVELGLLAERLRVAMASAGTTLERLADAADIDPEQMAGILAGRSALSGGELADIADHLDVSVLDLLTADEPGAGLNLEAARPKHDAETALEQTLPGSGRPVVD